MYDICGTRSDGKVVNCPFGSPAVKVFLSNVHPSVLYFFLQKIYFLDFFFCI